MDWTSLPFIVVSGLPGSGKSTLAHRLNPALNLPVIDKDGILESLYVSRGTGDNAWRRALSRESDRIFQEEAERSAGAILVSFWHLPGMPADSGTPTDWLKARTVCVHCSCKPETAVKRFLNRTRHPGHLDAKRSEAEVLASFRALADLGRLPIEPRIEIDTERDFDFPALVLKLKAAVHLDNFRSAATPRSKPTNYE